MQVAFIGRRHVFGDMALVVGAVVRRSNDVQSLGAFWTVEHSGSDLMRNAKPMLEAFAMLFVDTARKQTGDLRMTRVTPPALAALGDCHTARHEAMCLWQAGQAAQ
jgi:hypothetical protein